MERVAELPQMAPAPQLLRVSTPLVDAVIVTCGLPRSGLTEAYHVRRTWIGLPLAGLFQIHTRGDEHVVHPAVGVVFPEGLDYRMTHPVDGGDTDMALMFREDVVEEALPDRIERVLVTGLDLGTRWAVGRLLAAMRHGDNAHVEEIGLAILRSIVAHLERVPPVPSTSVARGRIDRVRILMAERPELPWSVGALARLADYSPYHFAHLFRRQTGMGVHRYLKDLRLAAALARIESGEGSLASVAADVGFAHHSHLTASMRRRLGVTPRAIRAELRTGARHPDQGRNSDERAGEG
jgi:AraC-like DNA-binding protein